MKRNATAKLCWFVAAVLSGVCAWQSASAVDEFPLDITAVCIHEQPTGMRCWNSDRNDPDFNEVDTLIDCPAGPHILTDSESSGTMYIFDKYGTPLVKLREVVFYSRRYTIDTGTKLILEWDAGSIFADGFGDCREFRTLFH